MPVADALLIDVVVFLLAAAAATVVVLACMDVDEVVDLPLLVVALVAVVSRPSPLPRASLDADRTVGWCLPLAAAALDEDALALVPLLALVVKLERTLRVVACCSPLVLAVVVLLPTVDAVVADVADAADFEAVGGSFFSPPPVVAVEW